MYTLGSVTTPDWFSRLLDAELQRWIELSELQINRLYQHYEILLRWNERMNLTTVKSGSDTVIRHYCESLFFAVHLPLLSEATSIMDLGSGPGFPGFPMAVLKPGCQVTLVESNRRKAVFLRECARVLPNVSVLDERIEAVSAKADWVVARAIDPAEALAAVPRLAPNVGLMLGADHFSSMESDPRIAWDDPVRLPWGDRKLCVYGSARDDRIVPRGT
jgi:16S rRNA (guanine527-N7)-methyltransferase